MATINTEQISGFNEMSPEEQVKALLGYEFDDGAKALKDAEDRAAKLKAAVDKASSEAADYKKQLNAKLSDEELKQQETAATMQAMQEKLAEYEQREKLSTAKAAFLGGGFDEATAAAAAGAFIAGDIEKMSAAVKKFRETIVASAKSELMGNAPKPDGGSGAKVRTKEDILKIADYSEMQAAIEEYIAANGTW